MADLEFARLLVERTSGFKKVLRGSGEAAHL
jgi:hypothetical protein